MDRRAYLSGLSAAALAGCLATGPGSTLSGPSEPLRLAIESVATQRLSLRINDLGEDPPTAEEEVVGIAEIDEAYHDTIRTAAETRGLHGVENPPEGLAEAFDGHEFLSIDDTYYWVAVSDSSGVEVSFDAELVDDLASDHDPGVLSLSLENRGERTVEIGSGAPAPFGVLSIHPEGEPDGESYLLWTSEYEESDHVRTVGRSVRTVQDIGVITDLDPDDRVEHEYEIDPAGLVEGSYELTGSVGVGDGESGGSLPYTVRIQVL
ncbi:hypothetical protein [Natronorarus salvus]|uniref:hypothetical protein n=1 Tax=Natronorarus salvus TaxID=3117733 RepID=UPI002F261AD4